MNIVLAISKILVIVGGLNWGLIGLLDFNFVDALFGVNSMGSMLVYILVGIAAVIALLDFVPRNRSQRAQV